MYILLYSVGTLYSVLCMVYCEIPTYRTHQIIINLIILRLASCVLRVMNENNQEQLSKKRKH